MAVKDKKHYDELCNRCLNVQIKEDIAYCKAVKWKKVYDKTKGKTGVIYKLVNKFAKKQNMRYVENGTKALVRQMNEATEAINELEEYLKQLENGE